MGTLQAGEIDYLVDFELSEASLERIEGVFPTAARPVVAEKLRHLAFAYHEHLAMVRPDLKAVAGTYLKIANHVASRDSDSLVRYLAELGMNDPIAEPAHAYVFDDLHHAFTVWDTDIWYEILRCSEHERLLLRDHALSERTRLLEGYRHLQGGLRAHRLGFVVARLRTLLLREGIKPTAYYDNIDDVMRGTLVDLVKAFVAELGVPSQLMPNDLGQLARKMNRSAKPGTGAFAKLVPVTGAED